MKAVLLSAPDYEPLFPITADLPLSLLPVCSKPLVDYMLDLMVENGVEQVYIPQEDPKKMVQNHLAHGVYSKLRLEFVEETREVWDSQDFRSDDNWLVIRQPVFCDVLLGEALAFHELTGADVTAVVTKSLMNDSDRLVEYAENGQVLAYGEQSDFSGQSFYGKDCGVYITKGKYLPDLCAGGFVQCFCEKADAYACQTGRYLRRLESVSDYLQVQEDILAGKIICKYPQLNRHNGDVKIFEPVSIGRDVVLGEGCIIGPNAVIGDCTTVGTGVRIKSSVVHEHAFIGDKVSMERAVICRNTSLKQGTVVHELAVIGAGCMVGEDVVVNPEVRVWPGKTVASQKIVLENLHQNLEENAGMDDQLISGETGSEMTPVYCVRVGQALGSMKGTEKIGVAGSFEKSVPALKMALNAGLISTGAQIFDFGSVFESMFHFALCYCNLGMGAYVQSGAVSAVRIMEQSGLPVSHKKERELQKILSENDYRRASWNQYKEMIDMSGIAALYKQELLALAPFGLQNMRVQVENVLEPSGKLLRECLTDLGCRGEKGIAVLVSRDGARAEMTTEEGETVSPERVLALCCLDEFEKHHDIALPADAPFAITALAKEFGCQVRRYADNGSEQSRETREFAKTQLWARDGVMQAIKLLNMLESTGLTLAQAAKRVPNFFVSRRELPLDSTEYEKLVYDGEVKEKIQIPSQDRMVLQVNGGYISVRPTQKGAFLKIQAEAASQEIAEELCHAFDKRLLDKEPVKE